MSPRRPSGSSSRTLVVTLCASALSGVLLGCAFPPVDAKWLVWVGLMPLCWAGQRLSRPRDIFLCGYLAGLIFFLLTLHPLASAHSWTGWAAETPAAFAARMGRQWWFMQGICIAFAAWCALFWGVWLASTRWLAPGHSWRDLLVGAALWVLLPECARAATTFGFTWAFLGNALADLAALRQMAALGGVWLLSALVVIWNIGWARSMMAPAGSRTRWWPATLVIGLAGLAWAGGEVALLRRPPASAAVGIAAIQRHKAAYATSDFAQATGFDRSFMPMIEDALDAGARLIVLPESVALGVLTIDGTRSNAKPLEWHHERSAWDASMTALLQGRPSLIIVGLDTVEADRDYNTLTAWDAQGMAGHYHKRRLVPFAEYQPWPWAPWALQGRSQYSSGQGTQLIRWQDLVIGGFICQEVLFPCVTRESVRDGAALLVSGGNDGVFSDPAVAAVHMDAAQLRAVETGRFVIRAMKTGISGIIDPYGREMVRSVTDEPVILMETVEPLRGQTPYVRFGDWVLWVSAAVVLWRLSSAFGRLDAGKRR